jgi:hypothetical protein
MTDESRGKMRCNAGKGSEALKRHMLTAALALGFAAVAPLASHAAALPVIPNAAGFGIETPAGRGGTVYRVTNLNASGAGSLKACVDASGPRVCVFEVSGTIVANADLIIRNPNITIAGQTAPSPGILYRGGALWVATDDVLVQHMRFRAGDDPKGPVAENRDALKVGSSNIPLVKNIVIDHCSFGWAPDENVSFWENWDNITFSNNIVAEGLIESISPLGAAGHGVILGPVKGKAALYGNLLAHNKERNAFSRAAEFVFVNNVIYNRVNKDVDLMSEKGIETKNTVVGNVFIRGANYGKKTMPVSIRNDGSASLQRSKLYVADNVAQEANDDPWSIVGVTEGTLPSGMKTDSPPAWPAGFTRLSTKSDVVLNEVLRYSGARPADRDPVDARVVKSVRDRSGGVINCVSADGTARCAKNAGGWPKLAQNTRKLTIPSDPNAKTASGYTKLEVWLHEMAAQVEGRPSQPPAAPTLVSN